MTAQRADYATRSRAKRMLDLVGAGAGLISLSPLFVAVAAAIELDDGGPTFFSQERVGQGGRLFRLWKFRTMRVDAGRRGPQITRAGDPRVTRVGRVLRKTKLDELPQLWNVLVGDMSFVGPRPEVPKYVELYTDEQRRVLAFKPGITDLASIEFLDEEALLAQAEDPERFYVEHCLPRKIEFNLEYAARASLLEDTLLIVRTVAVLLTERFARRGG